MSRWAAARAVGRDRRPDGHPGDLVTEPQLGPVPDEDPADHELVEQRRGAASVTATRRVGPHPAADQGRDVQQRDAPRG